MDLPEISSVVGGIISIGIGFIVIIWPEIIAIMIGLYLIAIGAIAMANGLS